MRGVKIVFDREESTFYIKKEMGSATKEKTDAR